MAESFSFNLVNDDWLPVLYCDGNFRRISLSKAFADAEIIIQIACPNPTDCCAIYFFMLVVRHWTSTITGRDTPSDISHELAHEKEHFELFGKEHRFYQINPQKGEQKPIGYLFQEIPTGTNIDHFLHVHVSEDHTKNDRFHYGVCPACTVLGLLRLPFFTLQGGRSYNEGQFSPPYYFQKGDTLWDVLNNNICRLREAEPGEAPSWVKGYQQPETLIET